MSNMRLILTELECHHRSKSDLLEYYVKKRLASSIQCYSNQLEEDYNSILNSYKDSIKMVKKVIKGI